MKVFNRFRLLNLALLADAVMVGYIAYLAFWPFKAFVQRSPIVILNANSTVAQGQVLAYEQSYCKYTNSRSLTYKTFVGSAIIYPQAPQTGNTSPGCGVGVSRRTVVPTTLPPGKYHLDIAYNYQVNAIRVITVRLSTPTFTVVAPTTPVATCSVAAAAASATQSSNQTGSSSFVASAPTVQTGNVTTQKPSNSVTVPSSSVTTPERTPVPTSTPRQSAPVERIVQAVNNLLQ